MKFLDEAVIYIKAGNGGKGAVSFFPKAGGPDGGDGGRGGNIVFRSSASKHTLIDFKYKTRYLAENGGNGSSNNRKGSDGKDLVIEVPAGTVLRDKQSKDVIFDLDKPDMSTVVLKGGKGGRGNSFFCTASRQAPDIAQPGVEGKEITLLIELKLIADIGIIGLPNAGKSTLISRISAAKPKIADYPFTTLVPNLGVAKYGDMDFVLADVPGLIKDAHKGIGLGTRFLKHIERTKLLLHVVDVSDSSTDPITSIDTINHELKAFSEDICKKPMIYVLNKIDLVSTEHLDKIKKLLSNDKKDYVEISALKVQGLENVLRKIYESLKKV